MVAGLGDAESKEFYKEVFSYHHLRNGSQLEEFPLSPDVLESKHEDRFSDNIGKDDRRTNTAKTHCKAANNPGEEDDQADSIKISANENSCKAEEQLDISRKAKVTEKSQKTAVVELTAEEVVTRWPELEPDIQNQKRCSEHCSSGPWCSI
eukprot:gnl/MRDRNA2_/MRDRNA2_266009_c0_seq1.p1 gnl/MRDRNA2_/MRDRNA2_266009_c0~~gnl/MRDRNA2_/MRDRNA2_266009_c0_seq1.p1  ORF type:complete len:169 (+),score=36.77 gnl/MRDRNA2_/MRDRNA2_266009_c0_seq1:55-507(+)